MNKKIASLYKR